MHANDFMEEYLRKLREVCLYIDPSAFAAAASILEGAYLRGSTVYTCGNGGSAAIANHMVCDHSKGIRTGRQLATSVVSLSTNIELITAIANDISYDQVFRFQLGSLGRTGDVLFAVSSSGKSPNIIEAIDMAGRLGMTSIALTGFDGGKAAEICDVNINVSSSNYGVIEDAHQAIMHALAQHIGSSGMKGH